MAEENTKSLEADIQEKVNGYISSWVAKARVLKHLVDAMKGSGTVEGIVRAVKGAEEKTGVKTNCMGALAFGVTQGETMMGLAGADAEATASTGLVAQALGEEVAAGAAGEVEDAAEEVTGRQGGGGGDGGGTGTGVVAGAARDADDVEKGAADVEGDAVEVAVDAARTAALPAAIIDAEFGIGALWLPFVGPAMESAASLAAVLDCLGNKLIQETGASAGAALAANQIEIQKLQAELRGKESAAANMKARYKDAMEKAGEAKSVAAQELSKAHDEAQKSAGELRRLQSQVTTDQLAVQAEKKEKAAANERGAASRLKAQLARALRREARPERTAKEDKLDSSRRQAAAAAKAYAQKKMVFRARVGEAGSLKDNPVAPEVLSAMKPEQLLEYTKKLEKFHAQKMFAAWEDHKKNIDKLIGLIPFKADLDTQELQAAAESARSALGKNRGLRKSRHPRDPSQDFDLKTISTWSTRSKSGGGKSVLDTWKTIDTGAKAVTAVSTRLQKLASTLHGPATH